VPLQILRVMARLVMKTDHFSLGGNRDWSSFMSNLSLISAVDFALVRRPCWRLRMSHAQRGRGSGIRRVAWKEFNVRMTRCARTPSAEQRSRSVSPWIAIGIMNASFDDFASDRETRSGEFVNGLVIFIGMQIKSFLSD
jgi:hypothetical protein